MKIYRALLAVALVAILSGVGIHVRPQESSADCNFYYWVYERDELNNALLHKLGSSHATPYQKNAVIAYTAAQIGQLDRPECADELLLLNYEIYTWWQVQNLCNRPLECEAGHHFRDLQVQWNDSVLRH